MSADKEKSKEPRLYRGRTADQLREERRQRLLNTALELFSTRGYANTTIEFLCSSAKVTTRHFYEQFDGREAMLRGVVEQIMNGASQQVEAAVQDDSNGPEQRVEGAISGYMTYVLDDPRRARVLMVEAIGVSREMEAMRRHMTLTFTTLIEQLCNFLAESGQLPKRNYHLPAVAVIGAVRELISEWIASESNVTSEELVHDAIRIFRALIIGARQYPQHYDDAVSAMVIA